MSCILSPSILNSDFLNLQRSVELINNSASDWVHLDVMDGVFVPNISIGQSIVATVGNTCKKPLDVHLMIIDPDRYLESFIEAGAKILTVHYEACNHLNRSINFIKSKGIKAGVAINPHTPVSVLEEIINDVDLVLNMSVNPGFGGQKLITGSFDKIKRLKELILKKNSRALIQVDGGVDLTNYRELIDCGVDSLVVGSAIFKSNNPEDVITKMKS